MEPGRRTPAGPLAVQVADLSVPQFPCEQTKAPSRLSARARGSIQGLSGWAAGRGSGCSGHDPDSFPSLMEADQRAQGQGHSNSRKETLTSCTTKLPCGCSASGGSAPDGGPAAGPGCPGRLGIPTGPMSHSGQPGDPDAACGCSPYRGPPLAGASSLWTRVPILSPEPPGLSGSRSLDHGGAPGSSLTTSPKNPGASKLQNLFIEQKGEAPGDARRG